MAEIIHCPKCRKPLQVPENFFGQTVQCPECRHMFTAVSESVSPQLPVTVTPAAAGPKRAYDDDSYDDERRRDSYDDIDDRPRRRDRDRYDDDDLRYDEFSRPNRIRSDFASHRGGLIMAIGLVSLIGGFTFCLPSMVGPVAWAMATYDLREIREGRMDPSGEGMTRAGQICGIIGSILLVLGVLYLGAVMTSLFGGF